MPDEILSCHSSTLFSIKIIPNPNARKVYLRLWSLKPRCTPLRAIATAHELMSMMTVFAVPKTMLCPDTATWKESGKRRKYAAYNKNKPPKKSISTQRNSHMPNVVPSRSLACFMAFLVLKLVRSCCHSRLFRKILMRERRW